MFALLGQGCWRHPARTPGLRLKFEVEWYNGLPKTTFRAMGGGTFKNWDTHLAKATWLLNTRGSTNRAGPAQSKPQRPVEGDKVLVVPRAKASPSAGLVLLKDLGVPGG